MDAADANESGFVDTGDAIAALVFFFLGGAPLPPPGPSCGVDETLDGLSCVAYASCEGGLPDLAVVDFEVGLVTGIVAENGVMTANSVEVVGRQTMMKANDRRLIAGKVWQHQGGTHAFLVLFALNRARET